MQKQLAAELVNGGIRSSLQTVQEDYPSVQAVDGFCCTHPTF
ncbi:MULTISPECIES: hypothetical protein [unclassified Eikenella]|nr:MULTISPECIES: hypothetical protein [unclassified Eikenella]